MEIPISEQENEELKKRIRSLELRQEAFEQFVINEFASSNITMKMVKNELIKEIHQIKNRETINDNTERGVLY